MKLLGQLLALPVQCVVWAAVLLTPLLGVWFGSSLISFHGGPRELAIVGGALLFPILPVWWELRATRAWKESLQRRKQFGAVPKRKSSLSSRLILRTLAINLLLLAVLMAFFPKTAFLALATRGDWFVEGQSGPWAQVARKVAHQSAERLEWLHSLSHPNPYRSEGEEKPVPADVTPVEQLTPEEVATRFGVRWRSLSDEERARWAQRGRPQEPDPTPGPAPEPAAPELPEGAVWWVGDTHWPHTNTVHPVVVAMGPEQESSIEAVARHIAAHETEPFARVKALHDWVVTRLSYEHESLIPNARRPQDAASVFARRRGVCEGYARLMVALGAHTGDRVEYVVGEVREDTGEQAGSPHAWNAVQIRGSWYFLDVTWDDPTSSDGSDNYRTDYLFTPPTVAVLDHFPDQPRWQLLKEPLTMGDFLRQPFARPGLAREGLTLHQPTRVHVEVEDQLDIHLSNPRRLFVQAVLRENPNSEEGVECGISNEEQVRLVCPVRSPGRFTAVLFTHRERYGTYNSAASLGVTRR